MCWLLLVFFLHLLLHSLVLCVEFYGYKNCLKLLPVAHVYITISFVSMLRRCSSSVYSFCCVQCTHTHTNTQFPSLHCSSSLMRRSVNWLWFDSFVFATICVIGLVRIALIVVDWLHRSLYTLYTVYDPMYEYIIYNISKNKTKCI